jgi:hypothetical protein
VESIDMANGTSDLECCELGVTKCLGECACKV